MVDKLEQWQQQVEKRWQKIPEAEVDSQRLQHLGVICDGNRRAAEARGLAKYLGHQIGTEVIKGIARAGRSWGIPALTFWVWSTENWGRDEQQIQFVMGLAADNLAKADLAREFAESGVRFKQIGRKDRLGNQLADVVAALEANTKDNDHYYLNLALDYGGQDEINRAIAKLLGTGVNPSLLQQQPELIQQYLDTAGQPFVDLVVRTGSNRGEVPHTSGFMPLQTAYAGWDFIPTLFPDLGPRRLLTSINKFLGYERRKGR